ncbi:MAG: ABC transporter permease, partial [Gemmatimonadota bacterium]
MDSIDRFRPAFELGRALSGRDRTSWIILALVSMVCATSATLALVMLPHDDESEGVLVESPVPAGVWSIEWSPTVRPPVVEQRRQVRSLQLVAAGTAGLLSVLCFLVATGLWGQRLRVRRGEHFVHWAAGAGPSQQGARLVGEAGVWWLGTAIGTGIAAAAVVFAVRHTFPGTATLPPDVKAAFIVLTGLAVAMFRWERSAASGPVRSGRLRAYDVLGSPVLIAAVGVAVLSCVGLLAAHAPGGGPVAEPGAVVVGASLSELPESDRRRSIVRFTEELGAAPEPIGVASAGAARGTGHADGVSTECGRCFEGGMPMPIKTVRAEVHALSQDTFPHLGLEVLRGRDFDDTVDVGPPSVAIVSEALANRHFERGQALGKRVRIGNGSWLTVVGVARDAVDVQNRFEYAVYIPLTQ